MIPSDKADPSPEKNIFFVETTQMYNDFDKKEDLVRKDAIIFTPTEKRLIFLFV